MGETILPQCISCGKSIAKRSLIKSGGKRKFCSRECAISNRSFRASAKSTKNCEECGNSFRAKHVVKTKFCGNNCAIASRKAKPRRCNNCTILFSPVRWQKKKGRFISDKANDRHYCSVECRRIHLKKGKEKICIACGVVFTPIRRDSKQGHFTPYGLPTTCSHECHLVAYPVTEERKRQMSERFTGVGHPNWQGGSHREGFRGHEWARISEEVRERAGRRCEHCGKSEDEIGRKLDVNHIMPFHQHRKKKIANRTDNLEALCRSCHSSADWKWRKENPVQMGICFR